MATEFTAQNQTLQKWKDTINVDASIQINQYCISTLGNSLLVYSHFSKLLHFTMNFKPIYHYNLRVLTIADIMNDKLLLFTGLPPRPVYKLKGKSNVS